MSHVIRQRLLHVVVNNPTDRMMHQLTVRPAEQKVFYRDYDALRAELESTLSDDSARQAFYSFWSEHAANDTHESDHAWDKLVAHLRQVAPHLPLPVNYRIGKFHGAISLILSARFGRPVGYRQPRLLNVANTAFDHYKPYLLAFGWTLKACGHDQRLSEQDAKQTWLHRKRLIREGLASQDEAYRQDLSYNAPVAFLVPEIGEKLSLGREW